MSENENKSENESENENESVENKSENEKNDLKIVGICWNLKTEIEQIEIFFLQSPQIGGKQ